MNKGKFKLYLNAFLNIDKSIFKFKTMIKYILYSFLFSFIFMSAIILFVHSEKVSTIKNTMLIEKYVSQNNLILPFPNWLILPNNSEKVYNLMDKNIYEFHKTLKENYIYSDLYDCKYWAYVWANYWAYNNDEWNIQIIMTDNHIFTIFSNDNKYCIADQDNLNCQNLK